MRITIKECGTLSITGAVMDLIYAKGLQPESVVVDIDTVLPGTDVDKELAKARESFKSRGLELKLGTVQRDFYKEARANGLTPECFS